VANLLPLLEPGQPEAIRLATVRTLARFGDPSIAQKLLALYGDMPPTLKSAAREVLFARAASASMFLSRAEVNPAWAKETPVAQARLIAALSTKNLDERVRKLWGNVGQGTPEENLATIRRFKNDIRERGASSDPKAGARVYNQSCARCHKLFGSGGDLAMGLTNSNRGDLDYLLTQIVDPSVYIRKEYMTYEAHTRSGRIISGLMVVQDAASVTLIDGDYRKTRISRSDIDTLQEFNVSIMPEGLDGLTPQQRRDLLGYLQSPSKP
jgi:putative heme-binding domain-containing protein